MNETRTSMTPVGVPRDTNITTAVQNVTTSTIGLGVSQNVNSTDIDQIKTVSIDTGISIQEQVIIGACVVVGVLAIVAIVLRILMPMFRKAKNKREKEPTDQYDSARKISGAIPHYRLPSSIANSQSSSASSISQYDISDSSSNQTRSTYCSQDSRLKAFGNLHGSTLSLPVYVPESRCGSCDNFAAQDGELFVNNLNDNLLGMLSTKSLEPLRMGDAYRHRWDAEFDPEQSTPTGSLSSLSHPSESRSTAHSNTPVNPSIDQRRQIKPPSYSASLKDSSLFSLENRPRYESRLPTKL